MSVTLSSPRRPLPWDRKRPIHVGTLPGGFSYATQRGAIYRSVLFKKEAERARRHTHVIRTSRPRAAGPTIIVPSQPKTLDPPKSEDAKRPRLSPRAATATATAASLTRLHGRHGRAWRWPHPAHRFSTYQTEFVIRSFMGGLLDVSRRFLNVRWTFRSTMEVLTRVGGRGNHHVERLRAHRDL